MKPCQLAVTLVVCCNFVVAAAAENWPGWRGPRGDGTSLEKDVPLQWDGSTGKNILWKTPLPGWGHSSPIVWEDRIFTLTCVDESQERMLLCVDRRRGEILWQASVMKTPLEKRHKLNSYASGTPATDGEYVYLSFLEPDFGSDKERTPGDMIVAAFDFAGKQKWLVKPGRFASVHGFCSSPVLFEDKVIVNGDHDGDAYIVALDRNTGETVWKTARENKTRSYVTPLIRDVAGRTQMVLSGSRSVCSYDPHNGQRHWIIDGPTEQYVASPVFDGATFYMTAGFPTYHVMRIRPDGQGNVTDTHVDWHITNARCYVPSPVIVDQYLFIADDRGTANCFDTATGDVVWKERLGQHYSASLVTAHGLVYFLADDGVMKVVRPGATLDVVAENELGEYCFASPAISQGQMFLRGEKHLFCIGTR